MSHPDEGTIQALLDDELTPGEREQLERHLAGCTACGARVAEARGILEEADRLVGRLTVPALAGSERGPSRRRALIRNLAWAASIVIAVGVGYWGRGTETLAPGSGAREARDTGVAVTVASPAPEPVRETDRGSPPGTTTPPARPLSVRAQARADAASRAATGEAKTTDRIAANERQRDEPAAAAPSPAERMAANQPAGLSSAGAALQADESRGAWRVSSMEEAVRVLGGQLRLIDGLTPDRVEVGPGTAVPGADPSASLVRVVYAGGAVLLDQQRPITSLTGRQEAAAKAVGGVGGQASVTAWQDQGGIRFVVTGSVSPDSLRALGAMVR